jgi:hypothetical protein
MNSAEKEFWGSNENMEEYLKSVRRPGEERNGYDDRPTIDDAIVFAEVWGDACETILRELLKMKAGAEVKTERRPTTVTPKVAVA